MKTSLKLIALLIAAGFPCVALAQLAGLSVPSVLLGLFVTAFLGLMMVGDYKRKPTELGAALAPVVVPPAGTFASPATETRRLAA